MAQTFPDLSSNAFASKTFAQVIDDFRSLGLEVKVTVTPFPPATVNKAVNEAAGPISTAGNEVGGTEGAQPAVRTFGVNHRSPWADEPAHSTTTVEINAVTAQGSNGENHSVIVLDDDSESVGEDVPHYVVTAGRKVGVFSDSTEASSYVTGVSHACNRRFKSYELAQKAFQKALAEDRVVVLK